LTYAIHHPESSSQTGNAPAETADVLLILNFTMSERSALLNSPSTLALLYTPMNEHFGIGPVEAMVCGLPVLACNSGGPTETVVDIDSVSSSTSNSSIGEVGTGWLRPPKQDEWALVMHQIITMPEEEKKKLGKRAKEWGRKHFALESLGRGVERAVVEAGNLGPVRWGYGLLVASWMVMGMVVVQILWRAGVLRS
jgi:alpha-1,3/alpha-1,6-mannosyltransferase